ncbi:MAG TPA: D-glycerate dehydrogenase [Acidimicrobiales bacterium]
MSTEQRPKIFVARTLLGDALERLEQVADVFVWPEPRPPSPAEFLEHASAVDAIVTMVTDRVDEAVLEACPSLRVIANVAVGIDNFDVPALTRHKVPAGNTPGVLTNATADMTFALLLASARRVVEGRDAVLAGEWTVWDPALMLGLELTDSTLGIVGMGRIGQAVAKRALAFSMRVIATSRTERPVEGVTYVEFETLLRESDVVSLHVALSEATRHLISARELAAMKPSAILINTARGAVIDQAALAAALSNGTIGGAGLDVFEREPLELDDPILAAPNCIVVPHIAASTYATRNAMGHLAADNIIAGLSGERLPNCVNPEVYES